ncbi:MAG: hypothetical protein H6816_12055 [Phycisphaerales bacterium]|nr:hypothetical protein [Phycisphaerales bacterium]
MPALIGDHMVLQRSQPAHLWGWAEPGERVTVEASWPPPAVTATAGPDRRWAVELPAPDASGPHTITFAGRNRIVVRDVLVGEVDLARPVAASQSNMQMPQRADAETEIANADHPAIRLFTVGSPRRHTVPQDDSRGVCAALQPDSVGDFSAAAHFSAATCTGNLMPIGLIHAPRHARRGVDERSGRRRGRCVRGGTRPACRRLGTSRAAGGVSRRRASVTCLTRAIPERRRVSRIIDCDNRLVGSGRWTKAGVAWETHGPEMQIDGVSGSAGKSRFLRAGVATNRAVARPDRGLRHDVLQRLPAGFDRLWYS